jgi:ATP-binding cassette, subfamily F, member 3
MLKIQNLEKSYGAQHLFKEASFQMTPRERLGLVGRNGHGKSTLFKIILGEETADDGTIEVPRNYRIGHLEQHIRFSQPTVLQEACLGLPEGEEYDHYKAERILFGLGFGAQDMDRAPEEFSGGFQVRLNLAKVLVSNPNLLLLDEPTNYLDIVSLRWITRFLRSWENELIIISHDREFMDSITTHTALIHRGTIRRMTDNTTKLYAQIAQEEEIHEQTRLNEEKQRKHVEAFVDRFRAKASKASAVQSRIKQLNKMSTRDKLAKIADLNFRFHYAPIASKILLEAKNISFHFDSQVPLISQFNLTVTQNECIAVIGKNGKGKTTLLNLLARELKPKTGTIKTSPNLKLAYFGQTNIERLNPELTVAEEISAANLEIDNTGVRSICGSMMFSGKAADKKVQVLSGGEKSRVMLGKILAAPANMLLLDEPTNHLDMQSIDSLIESIQEFSGTVIMVTHSEMILRQIATKFLVFQHGQVELFNGTYDEFLEKVGWDEENDGASRAAPVPSAQTIQEPKPSINKKELRKERAELMAQRTKVLGPLKEKIEILENEIIEHEATVSNANAQLAEASQNNNVSAFVEISKTVKEAQKLIDKKFKQLETLTKKHDEKLRTFDAQ